MTHYALERSGLERDKYGRVPLMADVVSPDYWEEMLLETQSGGSLSYFMGEPYQRGAGEATFTPAELT